MVILLRYLLPVFLLVRIDLPSAGQPLQPLTAMLINKQWLMTDYGFDENLNDRLDPTESRIEDCEKDDTYEFYKDGSGLAKSNSFSCCDGLDEQYFRWQLTGNGKSLLLFTQSLTILRLTPQELITYTKLPDRKGRVTGLITIYKTSN